MLENTPHGLARVAQEAAAESVEKPPAPAASVVAKVAKKVVHETDRNLRGAEAAAEARAKREAAVSHALALEPRDSDDLEPARRPGICLVRFEDEKARRLEQKLKF